MFWFGLILTVVMGLIGIPTIRDWICSLFPWANAKYIDYTRIVLLLIGAIITVITHIQKVEESSELRSNILALREYSVVARLNPYGLLGLGSGLKDVPDARLANLKETWVEEENNTTTKCDDASLEKSRAVTVSYPQFPWSYFHLADCLLAQGNPAWKDHAKKAIQIFGYTTSLADHHSIHDKGLKVLREYLNTR